MITTFIAPSFRIDNMVGSPCIRRQGSRRETVPVLTHNGSSTSESEFVLLNCYNRIIQIEFQINKLFIF